MAKTGSPLQKGSNRPRALDKLPSATAGLQPIRWADLPVDQRHDFLEKTSAVYMSLVKEIVRSSDQCVDKYEYFMGAHAIWRWIVIISTGMIAVLNIIVSHIGSLKVPSNWTTPMSVVASVFAVTVTILATLEGFTNAAERAQGYRESREMFVDVSEEFISAWETMSDR